MYLFLIIGLPSNLNLIPSTLKVSLVEKMIFTVRTAINVQVSSNGYVVACLNWFTQVCFRLKLDRLIDMLLSTAVTYSAAVSAIQLNQVLGDLLSLISC